MEQNQIPEQSSETQQPQDVQQPQEDQPNRGSIWLGFGLFWAISIAGGLVLGVIEFGLSLLLLPLPMDYSIYYWLEIGLAGIGLLLPLAFCIWFAYQGKTRTALGIALGYALIIALVLLFLSICALIFAGASFH
ncbi:MAG: hypothetical protein LBE24_09170 [Methylobacillus sp.]|jgi:phosphotransferase system  glucose/maltose/N-acetylglucosamine-specific IIC component|nr:hypothetical protein [Methylobacillus sp.]